MLMQVLVALAIGLVAAAPVNGQDRLEGTYIASAGEEAGLAFPPDHFMDTSVVITAKDIIVYCAKTGEQRVYSYERVLAEKAQGIDMRVVVGPDEGKIVRGIYELNGDRLMLAFFPAGKEGRPTSFDTEKGTGQMTLDLKRVAP